jgi:Tol biopolymer transport system component
LLPITFEGTTDSLSRLDDFSYGYDYTGLKLPSPYLIGLPADAPSRQELYRAYEIRLVQALIYQASGQRLNMTYLSSKEFVRWELAQAGLAGPYIGEAITRTLITAPAVARQPLGAISLRWRSLGLGAAPGEVVMPLAFDFLEQQFGSGTVVRLLPALISNRISILGDAINLTLRINPATLEPAWQRYLRERSGLLPVAKPVLSLPGGELALGCTITRNLFSIWRIRADGTGVIQAMDSQSFIRPVWSPDGKHLAFLQNEHAFVVEAESQRTRAIREGYRYQGIGWLPDGRVRLDEPGGFESSVRAINLDSGQDVQITGTNPTWSPDGQWMTYLTTQYPTTQTIWLAEANGQDARPLVSGYAAAWSPGGTRLAFVSGPLRGSSPFGTGWLQLNQISIVDITSGIVKELARASDLIPSSTGNYGIGSIGNLTWSPDSTMLAVALSQQNSATLSVLSADSGTVLARWRGANARWIKSSWSQDNHYLAFGAQVGSGRNVTSAIGLLDTVTGETVTVPGRDFDWSPDGKWLAIPQEPSGILLVTPDFATMRWLDTPNCMNIAWRPSRGE